MTTDLAIAIEPASTSERVTAIAQELEITRLLIEARFSDAGERLATSLEMVGQLIESLDRLRHALNAESMARTTEDLLATAGDLGELPSAQRTRVLSLEDLRKAGSALRMHVDEMRRALRYLRAFAMNVKITAGGIVLASDEFAGFAEQMCGQLDLGGGQLDGIADELIRFTGKLDEALDFERGLGGKYQKMIPAVPKKLAVDATAIEAHHVRIAEVAHSVSMIAQNIQARVATALTALQIGDITRQRIEHVQLGLTLTVRLIDESGPASESKSLAARRVLHLLADQTADIAAEFELEAAKVTHSLAGMAEDTAQILCLQDMSAVRGSGGLRDLEINLGQARVLIGEVGEAMSNVAQIGGETASAVRALSHRVETIHGVKRDIQQMAINSSLRCSRLGQLGKPLAVIAVELGSHAGQLEQAADQTLDSLGTLAAIAGGMEAGFADGRAGPVDAGRLDDVRDRLREAADVVEKDLAGLSRQGEATALSLEAAAGELGLKEDLGDALHTAAIALAGLGGPVEEPAADVTALSDGMMVEIARSYTMARERRIHEAHVGVDPEAQVRSSAPLGVDVEFEDAFF